ncbi:putative homogentisate 1,2-dioxygenase [Cladorrhinum sp. PSN332]|nr:putative homogentisate 1,2-dioxygenase [Cladorrhinum sp. PSN332]
MSTMRVENPPSSPVIGTLDLDDPYSYQSGFGNHHSSEALEGAFPLRGNVPQKSRYNLYTEHMNGTSFISSRESVLNLWMYRRKPAAAHEAPVPQFSETLGGVDTPKAQLESCFLPTNPNVKFTPLPYTWGPVTLTNQNQITFLQGLRTIAGNGDSTLSQGLAVHQYAFNTNMPNEAFVNHDGEFLIIPHSGTLDVKSELGTLRVKPGFIAVLPPGIRYSINLVSPFSSTLVGTGYVLELFGTHFTLPSLGPLGGNGLARVNDFQYPVACFDDDPNHQQPAPSESAHHVPAPCQQQKQKQKQKQQQWKITIKLSSRLYAYAQPHSPFDVVAWHGRYAPYRYDLSKFAHLSVNTDQLDPTAFCVLTAPSLRAGVSVVDFCIFGEKWLVAEGTMRVPYYHRTMATEVCGLVRGEYGGSSRPLAEGGICVEASWMGHGEGEREWRRAREEEDTGAPRKVGEGGYLGFMFHISAKLGLTKFAVEEHPDIKEEIKGLWDLDSSRSVK